MPSPYYKKTQICLVCNSIRCRCHILKRHRLYRIESKTGRYECKKCNHTYEKCYCKGGIKYENSLKSYRQAQQKQESNPYNDEYSAGGLSYDF